MDITTTCHYLIFREGLSSDRFLPFLFSNLLMHREVANFILKGSNSLTLKSGGVCVVTLASGDVTCYDSPLAKGIRSGKNDAALIKQLLFN
jgi:hypothetical protein